MLIVENLIIKAAEIYGVEPAQVNSRCQKAELCITRGIVWHFTHKELALSFRKIGDHFKRDHKTILTAATSVEKELSVNTTRKEHYNTLHRTMTETLQQSYCK